MRTILKVILASLLLASMSTPTLRAQRHGGARQEQSVTRGESRSRTIPVGPVKSAGHKETPSNNKPAKSPLTARPDNNLSTPQPRPTNPGMIRPTGHNSVTQTARPSGQRPGGNHGHRPGVSGGFRPGTPPPGPSHGFGPGGYPRPPQLIPPRRPGRPVTFAPWHRPAPPPGWRPYPTAPRFSTILGITIGTTIGLPLDYLYNGGYAVDGYSANQIYLRNVSQFDYLWPDATLYYGANGGLVGSEYLYSTPLYNTSRYYSVYNRLVAYYGLPATVLTPTGGMGAQWFGPNGAFVTLQFTPQPTFEGTRYFTTLTFGI